MAYEMDQRTWRQFSICHALLLPYHYVFSSVMFFYPTTMLIFPPCPLNFLYIISNVLNS